MMGGTQGLLGVFVGVLLLGSLGWMAPPAQAQNGDVTGTFVSIASDYGPETYKTSDAFNTRNANDFQNQTQFWSAALGLRLTLQMLITNATGVVLPESEGLFEVEAYIDTPQGRLWGWAEGSRQTPNEPGNPAFTPRRNYTIHFDIDGAPPHVQGTAFPPLAPGFHIVHADIYYANDPLRDPGGGRILAGTAEQPMLHTLALAETPFASGMLPETLLRDYTDVGPGQSVAAPLQPWPENTELANVAFHFGPQAAGQEVVATVSRAVKLLPKGIDEPVLPAPVGTLPEVGGATQTLGSQVSQLDEATVQMEQRRFDPVFADSNGTLRVSISAGDLTVDNADIYVIGAHLTGSGGLVGAASFVLPVTNNQLEPLSVDVIQRLPASPPGINTQELEVLVRDETGTTGNRAGGIAGGPAGDLFAIQTVGGEAQVLAKGNYGPPDSNRFITARIPALALEGLETNSYHLVTMAYQGGDDFYGMTTLQRGFSLQVEAPTIAGERIGLILNRPTPLIARLTSLTTDFDDRADESFLTKIRVTALDLPQGGSITENVTLREGETRSLAFTLQAPNADTDYTVRVRADSTDITQEQPQTLEVFTEEEARALDRRWYEVPAPGAILLAWILVGLAALHRRRAR